jgi:hypothetical protein
MGLKITATAGKNIYPNSNYVRQKILYLLSTDFNSPVLSTVFTSIHFQPTKVRGSDYYWE